MNGIPHLLSTISNSFVRGRDGNMENSLTKPPTRRLHVTLGIVMLLVAAVFGYLWLLHRDRPTTLAPAVICLIAGILNSWRAGRPQK